MVTTERITARVTPRALEKWFVNKHIDTEGSALPHSYVCCVGVNQLADVCCETHTYNIAVQAVKKEGACKYLYY